MKRPLFSVCLILILICAAFNYFELSIALAAAFILACLCIIFVKNRELKAVFAVFIIIAALSDTYFTLKNEKTVSATEGRRGNYQMALYDVKEHPRVVTLRGKLFIDKNTSLNDVYLYLVPKGEYFPGDVINLSAELEYETDENLNLKPIVKRAKITSKGKSIYKPYYILGRLRLKLNEAALKVVPGEISRLFPSLLTGNKNYLTPRMKGSLYNGGIAHIAAVSGLHLSIILSFAFLVFPLKGRGRLILAGALCLFVMGISAFSPSIMRASLMVMIFLLSRVIRRDSDGITSLSFFLVLILLIRPGLLFSLSTILSCLSVFGILTLAPFLTSKLPKKITDNGLLNFLSCAFIVSFSASFMTLPAVLYYFGSFSLLSLLLNIIVVPAVTILLPLLWIEVILIALFNFHIPLFDLILAKGCEAILKAADLVAASDFLYLTGTRISTLVFLSLICAAVSYLILKKASLKRSAVVLAYLLVMFIFSFTYEVKSNPMDKLLIATEDESCVAVKNGSRAVFIGDLTDNYDAENLRKALKMYGVKSIEGFLISDDSCASAVTFEFLKSFKCPAADEKSKLVKSDNYEPFTFLENMGVKTKEDGNEISFDFGRAEILKIKNKCDIIKKYQMRKSGKVLIIPL